MQKFIKVIPFLLVAIFFSPLFSTAQNAKPFLEKDPPQYGKPFAHLPDTRDVTLYQVNMRTFSTGGNFKGVLARLDSIKALGINVIYLMPVYPVGVVKTSNSPYCVKDYKGINSEFGTLNELRAIVDGAHSRNMAIILDWVPNHTSFDNAWTANKSWYLQDSAGNIISPPGTGWNDVAQLNYHNADMRLAMINAMKYWVLAANIDGFRCDFADGPPVDFWKEAINTLRHIPARKLLMMAEGSRSANFEAGFDYNFGFRFFEKLKRIYKHHHSVLSIDSLNITDYKNASGGQQIIRYVTNHDVNSSDGTPLDLFGGEKGSMAAFVVVAYMKSIPMIYNGQEVGTPYRIVFPFTSKKIDWTINAGITAEYKKVIAFRNSSNAIRRGNLTSYTTDDVCAFTKISGKEEVLVISNLRETSIEYTLPAALKNSTWQNAMEKGKVTLAGNINYRHIPTLFKKVIICGLILFAFKMFHYMPLRKSVLCLLYMSLFIMQARSQQHMAPLSMNKVSLYFGVDENGIPRYSLSFNGKPVMKPSRLGFIINDSIHIDSNFHIIKTDSLAVDETWKPVWGEVAQIRNHYKQVTFHLQQQRAPRLLLNIVFKVFEDGVGFRYEFPVQPNLKYITITDELTQFILTGDHKTFWIPGDYDSNEYPYTTSKISEVDAWKLPILSFGKRVDNIPDEYAVQTPLMMKTFDGLYINIHEAALVNYSSMQLHVNRESYGLSVNLVPDAVGNKAYLRAPAHTPWRTIIVSDKATDILASKMILNLNEPSKIENTSWIQPMKFTGVWWKCR